MSKNHEQTILEISQGDYIAITAESFLIDRQARELSKKSLKFYRQFLKFFIEYCDANSLKQVREVTPEFLVATSFSSQKRITPRAFMRIPSIVNGEEISTFDPSPA